MSIDDLLGNAVEILEHTPEGLSEYDLICRLADAGHEIMHKTHRNGLGLFRQHFLLMHVLYELQRRLSTEGRYLSISAQSIRLQASAGADESQSIVLDADAKLRDYYLDWRNFEDTSEADVERLLGDFWSRYHAWSEREDHLKRLGLGSDANWREIQSSYRRLIKRHHPDKGGEQKSFIEIREAYEALTRIHGRQRRIR